MAAAEMFARGKRHVDVVDALGVSAQTASRWHRTFVAEGKDGLAGAGRAGRLPKLSDEQLAQVEQALLKGPRANGFPTEMWTPARVADVVETLTGIRYGQTQTLFIVAVIFFSGFVAGRTSGGYHGWHRSYQGGQMGPNGSMDDCPMIRHGGMGPGGMRPGGTMERGQPSPTTMPPFMQRPS